MEQKWRKLDVVKASLAVAAEAIQQFEDFGTCDPTSGGDQPPKIPGMEKEIEKAEQQTVELPGRAYR